MSSLLMDLRVAIRALVTARTFSIIAVTTLAVAIGATTAIYPAKTSPIVRANKVSAADIVT